MAIIVCGVGGATLGLHLYTSKLCGGDGGNLRNVDICSLDLLKKEGHIPKILPQNKLVTKEDNNVERWGTTSVQSGHGGSN